MKWMAVFLLLVAWNASAAESAVTAAMVGHWEGSARISVCWCHQKDLAVQLDIHADGSVTGLVGDAKLKGGRIVGNRSWLGRQLNWATDYLVIGDLEGAIVVAEGIKRSSVKIPVNFRDGAFAGGVNTSGSGLGGFDRRSGEGGVLVASSLKLTRSH